MRIIDTENDLRDGLAYLEKQDGRLKHAAGLCGPLPMRRRDPGLHGLMSIIVAQQVSVASANTIFARVTAQFAPFDPQRLLAAEETEFRACGLSGPKIRTIRSIAGAIIERRLDLDGLSSTSADDAHDAMVAIKGIGPWTADIYLMFCLGQADGFAAGDLALQEAARMLYQLDKLPSSAELAAMAERWRPWRSIAARLLWAYYKVAKAREGIGGG